MKGELADAADAFVATSVAPLTGKAAVVTSINGVVTVAGSLILSLGAGNNVPLGNFPVGRVAIKFPAGVAIGLDAGGASLAGGATKDVLLGGYTIPV